MTPDKPSASDARELPCPFCACSDLTFTVDHTGWKVVQCDDCGATGPCIDLEGDEYIDRWNTRASPAPQGGEREKIHSSDGGVEKHGDLGQTRSESPGALDRIAGVAPGPSETEPTKSAPAIPGSLPSGESDPLVRTDSAGAGADRSSPAATVSQDEWPLGCHDPDSCHRHQDCMYVGCRWQGKDTAFTPPLMQEDGK